MLLTLMLLKIKQKFWAKEKGIRFNRHGYVYEIKDNLFEPLRSTAKDEFDAGHGKELEGKMRALHSSSALACNFFHYWRFGDIGLISKALDIPSGYTEMKFEKTHKKPREVSGIPPHLDAELAGRSVKPVAIEAKFTEPYTQSRKRLKKKYVQTPRVWGKLENCRDLAKSIIDKKEVFEYLDAPQLLRHILGLKTDYGEYNFELLYIWYKLDSTEASRHVEEIERFKRCVTGEVAFRVVTYQEIFKKIRLLSGGKHQEYIKYMEERYFKVEN